MKLKAIILSALLGAGFANAASYTISTGSGAAVNGIADSTNTPFQNSANATYAGPGVIGIGSFNLSDEDLAAVTTGADLVSAFTNFHSSTFTFNSPGPGATNNSGVFSAATTGTAADFDGQSLYIFVGNGTTFANSTEFLILKTSIVFDADQDEIPAAVELTITDSNVEVIVGELVANVQTRGTDASTTPGWQTVAVPEPSAALLGMLGALGLLRRRR